MTLWSELGVELAGLLTNPVTSVLCSVDRKQPPTSGLQKLQMFWGSQGAQKAGLVRDCFGDLGVREATMAWLAGQRGPLVNVQNPWLGQTLYLSWSPAETPAPNPGKAHRHPPTASCAPTPKALGFLMTGAKRRCAGADRRCADTSAEQDVGAGGLGLPDSLHRAGGDGDRPLRRWGSLSILGGQRPAR